MVFWPFLHLFANSGRPAFSSCSMARLSFSNSLRDGRLPTRYYCFFLGSGGHLELFSLCVWVVVVSPTSRQLFSKWCLRMGWGRCVCVLGCGWYYVYREQGKFLNLWQSVKDERSEFKWLDWEPPNFRLQTALRKHVLYRRGNRGQRGNWLA